MSKKIILSAFFCLSLVSLALADDGHDHSKHDHMKKDHMKAGKDKMKMMAATTATAYLHPTEGNKTSGKVVFHKNGDKVTVTGEVTGLTPGDHGFHIHEFGDCSGKDGKTAGGHFNPEGYHHGGPKSAERHDGDLGNITADKSGVAKINVSSDQLTFTGIDNILGRGVIVHMNADDMKTQPTGAAGARVACGVIGASKRSGK